jgi:hypothetical protein
MDTQNQSEPQKPKPSTKTQRDEQTLGRTQDRQATENPQGFADEVQPTWAPPETQPEPLTSEPVMSQNQPSNSSQSTNTNSPA